MNFEESIKQLEEIAKKLESGNCTLDESIELYEKALALTKECSKVLENAKLKITNINDAHKAE
jgi:exodeoxyribonuclease VII small subunit